MNVTPRTVDDLQRLVADEVQESLHLDYKSSAALTKKAGHEIAKDVSAFANSDGGTLVYGIEEKAHIPTSLDEGVENSSITREWIEQCIHSNVAPKITGIEIVQIPLSGDRSAFSVFVPKTFRGPHQERKSRRYYKRYNFESAPMEDYEIADVRARASVIPPLINIDSMIRHHTLCMIIIENIGDVAAHDVTFDFPADLNWRCGGESPPPLIERGIVYFGPGKRFEIFYNSGPTILSKGSEHVASFDVGVAYTHPLSGQRNTERFHLNFQDYLGTWALRSDVQEQGEKLEKALDKIAKEVSNLRNDLKPLTNLAGSTGLNFSVTALRNLRRLLQGKPELEKLRAEGQDAAVFMEVLARISHQNSKEGRRFVL